MTWRKGVSAMHALVESKRQELAELCRRFKVRQLELFGSAAGVHFNSATSDLDFLVEFDSDHDGQSARRNFGLLLSVANMIDVKFADSDQLDRGFGGNHHQLPGLGVSLAVPVAAYRPEPSADRDYVMVNDHPQRMCRHRF
jgi:uncharacterized protein